SLTSNCLAVEVDPPASVGAIAPARIPLQLPGLSVQSEILGTSVKGQSEIALVPPDASGRVVARGKTWVGNPARAFLGAVRSPAACFGAAVRRVLADLGVRTGGETRPASESELGQPFTKLAQVTSPIAPAITKMLKDSDNNIAEHLFKLAAACKYHRGT